MSRKSSAMLIRIISLGTAGLFVLAILGLMSIPSGSGPVVDDTPTRLADERVETDTQPVESPPTDVPVSIERDGEDVSGESSGELGAALQSWNQIRSGVDPLTGELSESENPYIADDDAVVGNIIDELVLDKLEELGIEPAQLCSDEVFVRRVYLDTIGTLPSADDVRAFIENESPERRSELIESLLARSEFADYWGLKWSDLLRVKAEFPINLWPHAAQAYHRWLRTAVRDNMPYDRFVRELLTSSGSNFRTPQVNFFRAVQNREPETIAKAVSLAFMGARAEQWPPERLAGMAAFFNQIGYKKTAEWKEEIVFFDPSKADAESEQQSSPAIFPDGTFPQLAVDQDPREVFADWLITSDNPWFTRHIVNRVWYWLLGRGIVHEPDDIRRDNPPQNLALLNWLAQEFVGSGYDLKHLYRLILNSKTYQRSCIPASDISESAENFGHYALRRLEAEVLVDALCQITGTTESYSSMIPEPFTFLPEDQRTILVADGSITSPFLEMFGRPPRDTGLESERNNRSSAAQRLHLLNSSHVRKKLESGPKLRALLDSGDEPREIAETLYLTILSRFPTDQELSIVQGYCGSRSGGQTIAWALINSEEFLHRH
jgi:hypothetical protein